MQTQCLQALHYQLVTQPSSQHLSWEQYKSHPDASGKPHLSSCSSIFWHLCRPGQAPWGRACENQVSESAFNWFEPTWSSDFKLASQRLQLCFIPAAHRACICALLCRGRCSMAKVCLSTYNASQIVLPLEAYSNGAQDLLAGRHRPTGCARPLRAALAAAWAASSAWAWASAALASLRERRSSACICWYEASMLRSSPSSLNLHPSRQGPHIVLEQQP